MPFLTIDALLAHKKERATKASMQGKGQVWDQLPTLEARQKTWLTRVADLLGSTPEHLLEVQLIDEFDLQELPGTNPFLAAKVIRSSWPPEVYRPARS